MRTIRRLHAAIAAVLVLTVVSCSSKPVTAPARSAAALTPATQAGLATVQAALESPRWQSLDALSRAEGPAPAAAATRTMLRELAATATTAGLVRNVSHGLLLRIAEPLAAVIPPGVRGRTYVFDADQRRYVPDSSRAGAPVNGVRYILYAVNPLTQEPVVSAEIGHADLTDEGGAAPNTVSLRLRAVSQDVTFVDYTVALAGAATTGDLAVHGTFFDGRKHLTFAIRAHAENGAESQTLALEFQLAVPEDQFALANRAHAVATPADSTVRAEQAVAIGDNTFSIASVHQAERLDATVGVNGAPFAVIHGDASTLSVLNPNGQPLSAEERVALGQLLGLFDGVSRLLGSLLAPIAALFALVPPA